MLQTHALLKLHVNLPTIETDRNLDELSNENDLNPNDLVQPTKVTDEEISSSFDNSLNLNDSDEQMPAINTGFIRVNDCMAAEETIITKKVVANFIAKILMCFNFAKLR